jgi:acetoacetate decarboxylase
MRAEDILALPSMPLAGPSYPKGPYRFINREYMVISYETDPEIVRAQLPEPLEPLDRPLVAYNLTEITVKGSWNGPGRLHLVPHVNAPVADLPVPYGRVLHDYLAQ